MNLGSLPNVTEKIRMLRDTPKQTLAEQARKYGHVQEASP